MIRINKDCFSDKYIISTDDDPTIHFISNSVHDEIIKLQEIAEEHMILKRFICDEGLYEKLLNSDEFIKWLRKDPEIDAQYYCMEDIENTKIMAEHLQNN